MKKSKTVSTVLLGVILGLLVLSFVPSVLGWGWSSFWSSTTVRPLDDWFYTAWGGPLNPDIGAWSSDTLVIKPHVDIEGNVIAVWDCEHYSGCVLDKELSDGRRQITVNLQVEGVPVVIETLDPENSIVVFKGIMNYRYQQKFIIDLDVWPFFLIPWADDDGYDENGNVLLPGALLPMLYGSALGFEFISVLLFGSGEGEIVNTWDDMEQGTHAEVKVAMIGYEMEDFGVVWPIDFINIF